MKRVILGLSALVFLVSCGETSHQESHIEKKESEAVAAEVSEATEGVSATYNIDSSSVVKWIGSKLIGGENHFGVVGIQKGVVALENGAIVSGEVVLDMSTIKDNDVKNPEYAAKLEGHLKSQDFFNVDSFPTATLKINNVVEGKVNADLTIKGKTKTIDFPAEVTVENDLVKVSSNFSINRTDWGVVYGSGSFLDLAKDKIIKDEINFEVNVVAKK